jgi:hypothetical protein
MQAWAGSVPPDIGHTLRRRALHVLAVLVAAVLSAMGIETDFEGGGGRRPWR